MSTDLLLTVLTGLASVVFSRAKLARDERHAQLVVTLALIRLAAWPPNARLAAGIRWRPTFYPDDELVAISLHNGRI